MNIVEALSKAGLDIQMDVQNTPNEWYRHAEFEAKQLCAEFKPALYFTFNCNPELQAYAIHKTNLVVVTAGLFDFLCRLADRIVSKGLFSEIGQPTKQTWMPDPERSAKTARELIRGKPFDSDSATWKGDAERESLFFYLLLTMFRFVVLHEIGHLLHRHGERRGGVAATMDIDTVQPLLLAEETALDAQARELVADKFAMDALQIILEAEIERIENTPFTSNLGKKLLDSQQKRLQFLLQAVFVYFSAIDRLPGGSAEKAILMSHPPAAFRLVTIAATAAEKHQDEMDHNNLLAATIIGDSLIAVALDRKPDPDWLIHMQNPLFKKHYKKLYARVPYWTRI